MKLARIELNGLKLHVFLGWTPGERTRQQEVTLDVSFVFASLPRACHTDQLDDTICYDQITTIIKKVIAQREFRLIEHLGHELYQAIKRTLSIPVKLELRLNKKPAITDLTKGVTFSLGDGD